MREIKFRGRNTKHQKRIYGDYLNNRGRPLIVQGNIALIGTYILNPLIGGGDWLAEYGSVGQSTGLFDKNGKEIYEGDMLNYCDNNKILYIVRYGSYNCNSGYKSLEPQYIGASFYLEVVNQELLREDLPIYSHNDCAFLFPVVEDFGNFEEYKKNWGLAVVGNIYENPELINQ